MIKISKLALLLASGLMMSCAGAETPVEATIKKLIEPRLGEGVKVDSVKETPYAGLYEINTGGDILYTDKNAQYLFVGHVFDAKTSQDLTKERISDVNRIKFSDLPAILEQMIAVDRVIKPAAYAAQKKVA